MTTQKKDPRFVEGGRRGGLARVRNQSPEERSASARHANLIRWRRVRYRRQQIADAITFT